MVASLLASATATSPRRACLYVPAPRMGGLWCLFKGMGRHPPPPSVQLNLHRIRARASASVGVFLGLTPEPRFFARNPASPVRRQAGSLSAELCSFGPPMKTLGGVPNGLPTLNSTHDGIGCSLSGNLPRHLQLFRMTIRQDPSRWQPGKPPFRPVYVNLLLIIGAILVVIFSIWGIRQLK